MERLKIEDKTRVAGRLMSAMEDKGFRITTEDLDRPWGFFFYVDERQVGQFIKAFYQGVDLQEIDTPLPLQPKILGVEPYRKLSFQYHHRRSERWRCVAGSVEVVISNNDVETRPLLLTSGEAIVIPQGIRHRAIGTDEWGIIAEIWQHSDPANPSNEEDIVRLQDDFGRTQRY